MNPKIILSFVAGLTLGGGAVYLLNRNSPPPSAMTAKLAKLETELAQKQTELTALRATPKSSVAVEPSQDELAQQTAESEKQMNKVKDDMAKQRQKIKERLEARLNNKVDEQLAVLKKKLGLTDEQMETTRGLLLAKLRKGDLALKAMGTTVDEADGAGANGQNMEKEMMSQLLDPMMQEKELDAKLIALLTPEQQAAYASHKQEQRANKVEMTTNKELAKLQGAMSLSSEQKDQIFSTLSQFAERENDKPIPSMIAMMEKQPGEMERIKKEAGEETATQLVGMVDELKQRQTQRREALKPILSEEQMKVYENLQQTSAFDMNEFMGDMGLDMDMMMMGAETSIESSAPGAPGVTVEVIDTIPVLPSR